MENCQSATATVLVFWQPHTLAVRLQYTAEQIVHPLCLVWMEATGQIREIYACMANFTAGYLDSITSSLIAFVACDVVSAAV